MSTTETPKKKIEKLTPEQEKRHDEVFREALALGTCTDPADRPRAEAAISRMYELLGEPAPKFVWCAGPAISCLAQAIYTHFPLLQAGLANELVNRAQARGQLISQLCDPLFKRLPSSQPIAGRLRVRLTDKPAIEKVMHDALHRTLDIELNQTQTTDNGNEIHRRFWTTLSLEIRREVLQALRAELVAFAQENKGLSPDDVEPYISEISATSEAGVIKGLEGLIYQSVSPDLRDKIISSVQGSLSLRFDGQHEMFWVVFYKFCEEIGVEFDKADSEKLGLWDAVGRSACWWFPYKTTCFVCERPTACKLNGRYVLHCEDGPAMQFRDGWTLWQIDGVAVNEQIVRYPHTQTIEEIDREPNADVKALRLQRFGWPRYLKESGAKCIDTRENDLEGTVEALYEAKDATRRLVVTCPTGRVFAIGVPNDDTNGRVSSCEEAQRWLSPVKGNVIART